MARLFLWRLLRTGVAVWGLASVVFLAIYHDPGAAKLALAEATDLGSNLPAATAAEQAATQLLVRRRLGLDLPLFYVSRTRLQNRSVHWQWNGMSNQYHRWATNLLHGNLGVSFRTGRPVAFELGHALAFTLPLTGFAAVLAVLGAVGLAQRLVARPWWRRPVQAGLVALHALPLFVVGLLLLLLFANPDALAWFPAYGLGQETEQASGAWDYLLSYAWHGALPVAALVLAVLPELTLQLQAALKQELATGYATTARAKGLAETAVIHRHALRNALLPTIAQIAEMLPTLVAGAVVVEVVFALPGMGRLLAAAAAARDYPVLVGGVLLTGIARLVALLLADLFYLWADPRIRWQS